MAQVLCIPQQYVCVLPYSTSCIYCHLVASLYSSDDNGECWVLDFGLLLLNSPFLPSVLSYITMTGTFIYQVGLSRSWYNCPCTDLLLSSSIFLFSMLDLSRFLIFWAAVSFVIHFCFIRLASFSREYLAFPASYSGINLVRLSLPCFTTPTIAALHVDSSLTNPHPPFCLLMYNLLTFAFGWWIPSMVGSFPIFQSIFPISFNQLTTPKL